MDFKQLVATQSALIIEKLITDVLSESHVEVRFDYFDKDQWAAITINQYEEDKEFSLRFHIDDTFDLLVGYYDDEDEYFEIIQPLTIEEVESIPEGLKKIMKKVVNDEQGLRVASSLLTPTKK